MEKYVFLSNRTIWSLENVLVQGYINIMLFGIFFSVFLWQVNSLLYCTVKSPYQYLVLKLLIVFVHINIYYYNIIFYIILSPPSPSEKVVLSFILEFCSGWVCIEGMNKFLAHVSQGFTSYGDGGSERSRTVGNERNIGANSSFPM